MSQRFWLSSGSTFPIRGQFTLSEMERYVWTKEETKCFVLAINERKIFLTTNKPRFYKSYGLYTSHYSMCSCLCSSNCICRRNISIVVTLSTPAAWATHTSSQRWTILSCQCDNLLHSRNVSIGRTDANRTPLKYTSLGLFCLNGDLAFNSSTSGSMLRLHFPSLWTLLSPPSKPNPWNSIFWWLPTASSMQGVLKTFEAIKRTHSTMKLSWGLKMSPFHQAHCQMSVCCDECGSGFLKCQELLNDVIWH